MENKTVTSGLFRNGLRNKKNIVPTWNESCVLLTGLVPDQHTEPDFQKNIQHAETPSYGH